MAKVIILLVLVFVGLVLVIAKTDIIDLDQLVEKAKSSLPQFTDLEGGSTTSGETNSSFSQQPTQDKKPILNIFRSKAFFPMQRTLVDSTGRPLDATILAKDDSSIALRRSSDGKEFAIPLSKLGDDDRVYFSGLANTNERKIREIIKAGKMAGRIARWNTNMGSAQRDAGNFGVPIYLLFTGTSWCPPCQEMEREVLSTREFQKFADQNLVLMKIVVPSSRNLRGSDEALAKKYGVSSYPTLVLVATNGSTIHIKSGASTNPDSHIANLKKWIASAN